MKLKKSTILVCCAIIASMGIALTGCGNNSTDKDTANNNVNVETKTEKKDEPKTETKDEPKTEKKDENLYIGTWKATVMESPEGDVYDYEETLGVYEITLNADYTSTGKTNDETFDGGTWELTEDGVKITESNGVAVDFIYKDGELIWDLEMGDVKAKTHFVKKQ